MDEAPIEPPRLDGSNDTAALLVLIVEDDPPLAERLAARERPALVLLDSPSTARPKPHTSCCPSCGVAVYPDDGADAAALQRAADAAFYRAKAAGRASVVGT